MTFSYEFYCHPGLGIRASSRDSSGSRRASNILSVLLLFPALLLMGCATHYPDSGNRIGLAASSARQSGVPANITLQGVPEIPSQLLQRLARYQNIRSASLLGWFNGGMLISTRFGETTQLHKVIAAGAMRRQLTFFGEPVTRAAVSGNSSVKGFVYPKDAAGAEFFQLYWYDSRSGSSTLLSDGHSRYSNVLFSSGGKRFAYTTTERDGKHWDIHIQDLSGNTSIALESERNAWSAQDWSADDRRLLLKAYVSAGESHMYELNLVSGRKQELLDPDLKISVGEMAYNGEANGIFFTADMGAEFKRLHYLDLASGSIEVITGDLSWNVEALAVSDDGRWLAYTVNEDGINRLQLMSLPERRFLALPEIPHGLIRDLHFDPENQRLGFTLTTPVAPADVYSLNLSKRVLSRWTFSEVGGLNPESFVAPQLIRYPSYGEADTGHRNMIPAFVYTPSGAQGTAPVAVVIRIHGGPESQARPSFSPITQFLVNELGVAVVAPNVRGSAGYGKSYTALDDGYQRQNSVADIGALLDWIDGQPQLDSSRIAVMGGSYGGYMVLASLVNYSDRLRAGIERVGISNFVSFLENTKAYRRDLRRAEYGDERDQKMRTYLDSISPLGQAHRITRPMMISQGLNDPRVPAAESEQMVAALRRQNLPVWYVLARDEGHGFHKKVNQKFNTAASMLFLQRFLLPRKRAEHP